MSTTDNTIDLSERRNGSPQRDAAQPSEQTHGDAPRPAAAEPAPRRRGRGILTGVLAIALLAALAVIGQLLGEREALRGEVATLTTALDAAETNRAEARRTLGGVADQLLALHGTLSSLLAESLPSGAEAAAAAGTSEASEAPRASTTPTPAGKDADSWYDRALELTR